MLKKRVSKFGNIPTRDITGKVRQSRREAKRGNDLFRLQQVGEIKNLRFANDKPKLKYELDVYGNRQVLRLLAALKDGPQELQPLVDDVQSSLTHITTYTPDFSYHDKGGFFRVEDSKGYKTPEYRLKKKLVKAITGVDVLET